MSKIDGLPNSQEYVLHYFGNKVSSGVKLNSSEELMVILSAASQTRQQYGPLPADMTLKKPALPESTQGVLANYLT